MSRYSTISVKKLLLAGFLLSCYITYAYGKLGAVLYGGVELMIAAICYMGCLRRSKLIDGKSFLLCFGVVMMAWAMGLMNGDPKSTLLITVPLIMPLYISTLNITYGDWRDYIPVTITAVAVSLLMIERNVFGQINSNTMGFLGFMGVSLGFLWVQKAPRKVIPTGVVVLGLLCTMGSGSRNVAIVGLICIVLLFLPKGMLQKPGLYFAVCLVVFGYSIFAADVMAWVYSKPKLYEILERFTERFSDKAWGMTGRIEFLRYIQSKIAQRDFVQKLFGTGTLMFHGHNMFYQCVLNFGYVGTILIYFMFWRVFKLAYALIRDRRDELVMGCVIVLWGTFLLQGADVFMLGPEAYAVVPQVLMGIILNRYATYRREMMNTNHMEK